MSDKQKYHVGFCDTVAEKRGRHANDVVYDVVHVCDSSNGTVMAFATSPERAELITKALNNYLK